MAATSSNYISDLFQFLDQLRINNNREWFGEHKDIYDELRQLWLNDLQRLIDRMSLYDPSLQGTQAKECAYRIYRDIRFSADKTPYKTCFSAAIGQNGRKCKRASYYLHIGSGNSALYAGLWCPTPDILRCVRSLIDAESKELSAILKSNNVASRFKFTPFQTLKKVPAGFAPNHPLAHLLKAKDYSFCYARPDYYFKYGNWTEKVATDFQYIKPVLDFINYVFE